MSIAGGGLVDRLHGDRPPLVAGVRGGHEPLAVHFEFQRVGAHEVVVVRLLDQQQGRRGGLLRLLLLLGLSGCRWFLGRRCCRWRRLLIIFVAVVGAADVRLEVVRLFELLGAEVAAEGPRVRVHVAAVPPHVVVRVESLQ